MNKEKGKDTKRDRRGYEVVQVNSVELDIGKDEDGKDIIVLLLYSDREQITGIIGMETEARLIAMVQTLTNGWITFNTKIENARGRESKKKEQEEKDK